MRPGHAHFFSPVDEVTSYIAGLKQAVATQDIARVKVLAQKLHSKGAWLPGEDAPLILAIKAGSPDAVKVLLEEGCVWPCDLYRQNPVALICSGLAFLENYSASYEFYSDKISHCHRLLENPISEKDERQVKASLECWRQKFLDLTSDPRRLLSTEALKACYATIAESEGVLDKFTYINQARDRVVATLPETRNKLEDYKKDFGLHNKGAAASAAIRCGPRY